MQVKRQDVSSTEVKLTIAATGSDLMVIKDQVVKRLAKDLKLPGFRAGKAPQQLLEKNLDQSLLQGDFLDEAMTQLYAKATANEKIRPVTKPSVSITEKDVSGVIESLQERMAEKKPVKRPAKNGDEALIDFKGTDKNDQPIESAEGKDYPLVLGSKAFIPGFEEKIVGTEPGKTKKFEITFPKDYPAANLAGQKVNFEVTVKTINELIKPEVNDAFAKKLGPFKDLKQLKDDIKRQLQTEKEQEAAGAHQEATLKAVSDKSKVDMPKALIVQQVEHNLEHLKRDLVNKGQTYQEFLASLGKTEDEYKKELQKPAEDQLKASLVLSEISEQENIQITPEELENQIGILKNQYTDEAMRAELDKYENRKDIASRMLSQKVVNFLVDQQSN